MSQVPMKVGREWDNRYGDPQPWKNATFVKERIIEIKVIYCESPLYDFIFIYFCNNFDCKYRIM